MIPSNELEVIVVFIQSIPEGWKVLSLDSAFPDCILEVNGKRIRAEFELQATNFIQHGHNILECDLIICWEDDWGAKCPLPVLSLQTIEPERFEMTSIDVEKALNHEHELRLKLEDKVSSLTQRVKELEDHIESAELSPAPKLSGRRKGVRERAELRRKHLLKLLCENPNRNVDTLGEHFGMTGQTIRNDYRVLVEEGKILYNKGKVTIPEQEGDF